MKIEIRKAESSKYASTLTQENMKEYYEKRNIQWSSEQFNESWNAFENLEVYSGCERVGVLRFSFAHSNCYIRDLQIEPKQQGRGIGKYCLSYAITFAKERSDKFIKLRVFSENPAIRMYSRYGFKKLSETNGLLEMGLSLT